MLHMRKTSYQEEYGESEMTNDEVSETLPQKFYKRRLLKIFQMAVISFSKQRKIINEGVFSNFPPLPPPIYTLQSLFHLDKII